MKGFYMSIDVSIAVALSFVVLIVLLITFTNVAGSEVTNLDRFKTGESLLYTLKNDGTLDTMVYHLDGGKLGLAKSAAVTKFASYKLSMHTKITLVTYDDAMNEVHSVSAQKGSAKTQSYVSSLAFKPDGTTSKYAVAIMEVGK